MPKSQSALEYMMTYGWAILIIVLIAAILFSFGIFNPSTSVTNAPLITGFSDIPVTTAVANNSFFKITLSNQYGQTVRLNNATMLFGSTTFTKNNCTNIVLTAGQYASCYVEGTFSGSTISVVGTIFYTIIDSNFNTSTTGTIRVQNSGEPLYPASVAMCSLSYLLNKTSDNKSGVNLDNVSWKIANAGEFAVVMAASGAKLFGGSFKIPSGCYFAEQKSDSSNSSIVICPNQSPGSYSVNVTNNGDSVALAAYIFHGPMCYYSINGTTGGTILKSSLPAGASLYLCDAASNTASDFLNSSVTDVNATNAEIGHQTGNICYGIDPTMPVFGQSLSFISLNSSFANVTTFSETGLPSNIKWNVTYDGTLKGTKSPANIIFVTLPGNYSYSATALSNSSSNCTSVYTPSAASGYDVSGTPKSIIFSTSTSCSTTFSESGLPSGSLWNVTYSSVYNASTAVNVTATTTVGIHSFALYRQDVNGCVYIPLNSSSLQPMFSGNLKAGAFQKVKYNLTYCLTTFDESGLPLSTIWNVTFNGTLQQSTSTKIIFNTTNRSLPFLTHIAYSGGTPYCQAPVSGNLFAGSIITVTYSSTCITTTFTETGLKSGKIWSAVYDNESNTSSDSVITLRSIPGTFAFTIPAQFNSSSVCEMALLSSNSSGRLVAGSTKSETFNETCAIYSNEHIIAGQKIVYNWSSSVVPDLYYPTNGIMYTEHPINSSWREWYEVNGTYIQYISSPFKPPAEFIRTCPSECPAAGVIGTEGYFFDSNTGYIYSSKGEIFNGSSTSFLGFDNGFGLTKIPYDFSVINNSGYVYLPNPNGQISLINKKTLLTNITVGNFSRLSTPYYGNGDQYAGEQTGLTMDNVNNYTYVIAFPLNRTLVISGTSVIANLSMIRPLYDIVDTFHNYVYVIDGLNGTNIDILSGTSVIGSLTVDKTLDVCSPPFSATKSSCMYSASNPIYNPGNHLLYVATEGGYTNIINGTLLVGNVSSLNPKNTTITGLGYDAAKSYVYVGSRGYNSNSSGTYYHDYITVINGTKGIANITVTTGAKGSGIQALGQQIYDPSNGFMYIGDPQDNQTIIMNQTTIVERLPLTLSGATLVGKYYEV